MIRSILVVGLMMISSGALAAGSKFDCKMLNASHGLIFNGLPLKVKISPESISIAVNDKSSDFGKLTGVTDPAYISRDDQGRTFVRFRNLDGSPEGEMAAVVESKMLNGKGPALFKMQWRGESFYQDLYRCVLKK
jgi:hypothetical protein